MLNRNVVGNLQVELVVCKFFVKRHLRDGNGKAVLVDGAADDDLGGKGNVAEVLIVAINSLGDNLALVIIDVLLIRQHVDAADVDNAVSVRGLSLGLREDFHVVI